MADAGTLNPTPAVIRRGLWLLARAVREEPRIYGIAVTGSAVYALMTVASSYALGWATTHVILASFRRGHTTAGSLLAGSAFILGVALVKAVGVVVRRIGAGTLQYRLQATYRRRVTRQYLRLPLSWHQSWSTGALLSNANSDVEAMWYTIPPFPLACGVVLMLVVTAGVLVATDWLLAVVGFVVFPAVGVMTFLYARVLSPRQTRAQQLRGEVSGVAHESFDGALVVKTLGREAEETARFRAKSEELRDSLIAVGKLRGMFDPLLEALPSLGVLMVLLVGAYRVRSGSLTTGELVQVAYLFTLLAFPVRAIGWVFADMPRAVVGWERVDRVLRATGAMPYGEADAAARDGAAHLGVRGVSYAYTDAPVLQDVTFDVVAGSTVAVVGPTGSGKSTLTGLLVRLVDPRDGTILLDGVDVRALREGELSDVAAIVPQQTFLFDDTIRGNVTLGLDVTDDDVWSALRVAQADRFVAGLPDGLDTDVGERGTTLSGGQRQRIALARAVVRRPRLMVLDDATSSVDPQVEQAILQGLARATTDADAGVGTSVVVVAYRRATIALADEVVYVEQGRVVARGRHTDLVEDVPGYRNLVTAYERAEAERIAEHAGDDGDDGGDGRRRAGHRGRLEDDLEHELAAETELHEDAEALR